MITRCTLVYSNANIFHALYIKRYLGTLENRFFSQKQQWFNSYIRAGCNDELFHVGQPVLAGINPDFLYCYLLSFVSRRDTETWGIYLLDCDGA